MLNDKKFLTIYEDYMSSGLTVRDYCSNLGMNEAKFYYWKKKLNNKVTTASGFVPVVFDRQKTKLHQLPAIAVHSNAVPEHLSFEICYANGTSIKLGGGVPVETIQQLLQLNVTADV